VSARESARQHEAGKDLIRAIFGEDAIAEDPILRLSRADSIADGVEESQ
jgi:hypothetical protein